MNEHYSGMTPAERDAYCAEEARKFREQKSQQRSTPPEKPNGFDPEIARLAAGRPRILVDSVNPDVTVAQLRDVFANTGEFFDRGAPVRLVQDKAQGGAVAVKMDADAIVLTAHKVARPYAIKVKEDSRLEVDARLPKSIASMYLADVGEWRLDVLTALPARRC